MLSLKKIANLTIVGLIFTTTVVAGTEDWKGEYTFLSKEKKSYTISHSPNGVQFMFYSAGGCLSFSKGTSINGFIIPEDVSFCKMNKIEVFTAEVKKLGVITNKNVTVGPTYPK